LTCCSPSKTCYQIIGTRDYVYAALYYRCQKAPWFSPGIPRPPRYSLVSKGRLSSSSRRSLSDVSSVKSHQLLGASVSVVTQLLYLFLIITSPTDRIQYRHTRPYTMSNTYYSVLHFIPQSHVQKIYFGSTILTSIIPNNSRYVFRAFFSNGYSYLSFLGFPHLHYWICRRMYFFDRFPAFKSILITALNSWAL
jgi:hypothetical protein